MKALVWSTPTCGYCTKAKNLLKNKGYEIEERVIGNGWTKGQLLESVPQARSVPQIFLDGNYIGGFDSLEAHFAKMDS